MKKLVIIGASIIVVVIGLGITFSETQTQTQTEEITTLSKTISIGTIHRDAAKMTDRYQPLIDHIAAKISNEEIIFEGNVIIPDSQEEVIKNINEQKMDIYFDSPIIAMKIHQETKMEPVLLGWKEGVSMYHTVFITPISSDITSLDDLTGKKIIFGRLRVHIRILFAKIPS